MCWMLQVKPDINSIYWLCEVGCPMPSYVCMIFLKCVYFIQNWGLVTLSFLVQPHTNFLQDLGLSPQMTCWPQEVSISVMLSVQPVIPSFGNSWVCSPHLWLICPSPFEISFWNLIFFLLMLYIYIFIYLLVYISLYTHCFLVTSCGNR